MSRINRKKGQPIYGWPFLEESVRLFPGLDLGGDRPVTHALLDPCLDLPPIKQTVHPETKHHCNDDW